jgi:hypothetical protein
MSFADSDRENRRFDIDEPTESDLVAAEDTAPGSAERAFVFRYDSDVPRAHPAFEPREDVRSNNSLRNRRSTAGRKCRLDDHLL